MAEPAGPRKTRPRSPTLDAAHEAIRAMGLRVGAGDPPQEDAGADSDLEIILKTPRAARPRNLRRRRAACPPPAPCGNGAIAPEKAGAPSNTPNPAPMTD